MEDKSFLELTNEEILKEIKIDPRLREPFKKIIKKLQAYFNANGYTTQIDYKTFFEKNLIGKDFKIYVSDEPSKMGAGGFYHKAKQCICIDEKLLGSSDLEHALCHEFIHFLVMNDKNVSSGFINEAQTEMFTRQIYPISCSYEPQVRMMSFANVLMNKANNFSQFLKGGIDSKQISSAWNEFCEHVDSYQKKFANKGFSINTAVKDEDYLFAQRCIITNNIHFHLIDSFEEYEEVLEKLSYAPVRDEEWMDRFVSKIEEHLLKYVKNEKIKKITLSKFKEYRDIKSKLNRYNDEDSFIIDFNGSKFIVNRFGEVREGFTNALIHKSYTGSFSFGDEKSIDIKKELEQRDALLKQEKELKAFLKVFSYNDERALTSISNKDSLIRLEKFELPIINLKRTEPTYVYVAVYPNKVEILNNVTRLGKVQNIYLCDYIGQSNYKMYETCIGKIDGIVFGNFPKARLDKNAQMEYRNEIGPTLSKEMMNKIIADYKKSDEYDIGDNEKYVPSYALGYYCKAKYEKLSPEEKKKYEDRFIEKAEKFIVRIKNGNVGVSLMKDNKTTYIGTRQVLIDKKGNGLYNEYINALSNENTNVQPISTTEEKKEEQEQNNTPMTPKEKYDYLNVEIRKLFKQNQQNPVQGFMEKMKKLIDEQDMIKLKLSKKDLKNDYEEDDELLQEQIESLMQIEENERIMRDRIDRERVEQHRRMI